MPVFFPLSGFFAAMLWQRWGLCQLGKHRLKHLVLAIAGYKLILDWPISIHLKFLLIRVVVTGILPVIYQLGVCYTPIRTMLNGKRVRRA